MVLMLMLAAVVGMAISGAPALLLGGRSRFGQTLAALTNILASLVAATAMVIFARGGEPVTEMQSEWSIPLGHFAIAVDALGMVFLVPVFLIGALGGIYGLGYWNGKKHPGNAGMVRFVWGILTAAMAMVVLARDAVLFLMAWEVMALAAFLLVAAEHHRAQVRRAAWHYLVATHIGTLCLFAFFALLKCSTGSFALWNGPAAIQPSLLIALTALGLVGFGIKAGIFPLHVWLPGAHANAPSHVSAILSGVMLKMGVYGLFRVMALVQHPPIWLGALVLGLGVLSALVGIAYAAGQADYKRLLAYSSIENIGIIMMGLGLGLLGQAAERPAWVMLGIGAALFHVLNHSLFKPLLFMGAGSLLHAVHTRRIDRLGGLARQMPWTFGLMLVGAVAICGLPPLNGFIGELLLYVGLLKTTQEQVSGWGWAALGVPALAAVGAMAVVAFVKLLGVVFLGEPRSQKHGHEAGKSMLLPMALLAVGILAVGILPGMVLPMVENGVRGWAHGSQLMQLSEFLPLTGWWWVGAALLGGVATMMVLMAMMVRGRQRQRAGTWDCGYVRPTSRMSYTGTSFVQMVVDLAAWALWPRRRRIQLRKTFPGRAMFSTTMPDVVMDRAILPAFRWMQEFVVRLRAIQQGSVQAYMVYVLVIIVILILVG